MLTEQEFQKVAAGALEELENRVSDASDDHGFDVEAGGGMLTLIFDAGRFIISPNTAARQIWVSALSTSFKFDWDDASGSFVLDKTREPFLSVMQTLLQRQLGADVRPE